MNDIEFKNKLIEITASKPLLAWARHIPLKYPALSDWINIITEKYSPINIMESIYIILNGPPIYCEKNNNKPRFINYTIGYQQFCKQGCYCFKENAAIKSKIVADNRTTEENATLYAKVTETCLKKYGATRATATSEVKNKTKETCLKKYGHVSYIGSDAYKEHCQREYGVDHYMQAEEHNNERILTNLKKYGVEHVIQSPIIREQINQTNLLKYGSIYPTQNLAIRQKMINSNLKSGRSIPPDTKSDWKIYNDISHFRSIITDYINTDSDKILFETYGIFSSKKNPSGVVRDHMLSRRDGFNNGIYPEIIRHPANCQIILHKDNASKGSKSNISINELFANILKFDNDWTEQELVIKLIKHYKSGNRWIRDDPNTLNLKEI